MDAFAVAGLYAFCPVPEPEALRGRLEHSCRQRGLTGTLILAEEGINGALAGAAAALDAQLDEIRGLLGVGDLRVQRSEAEEPPFLRLKVVVKDEIVTMRQPEAQPMRQVGRYLDPLEWNAMLAAAEVPVLDCRNDFEVQVGHFEGAVDPGTRSFTEFADFVASRYDPETSPRLAMYCTGGIRCEKASSLLLQRGFREVLHLRGGVLRYLQEIPQERSRWQGECFVFDRRVSLTHGLAQGTYVECHGCKMPVGPSARRSPAFEDGVSCPACIGELSPARRAALVERRRQIELAEERGQRHLAP